MQNATECTTNIRFRACWTCLFCFVQPTATDSSAKSIGYPGGQVARSAAKRGDTAIYPFALPIVFIILSCSPIEPTYNERIVEI